MNDDPRHVVAIDARTLTRAPGGLHAPAYAGTAMGVAIQATLVATLLVSWFYLRFSNPELWPPHEVLVPSPGWPTVTLVLLLLGVPALHLASRSMTAGRQEQVVATLLAGVLAFTLALGVGASSLHSLEFGWRDHAYGSMVWLLLGFHLTHVLTAVLAALATTAMAMLRRLGTRQLAGVRGLALYWYFVAVSFVPVYLTVYWAPRWGA